MMGGAQQGEDAWVLSPVIHFMGGTPEDHANVARANGKAVRSARLRRWRARLAGPR